MGYQILFENFSEQIRKYLIENGQNFFEDDVFREQIKIFTPSEFRAMLFYSHYLCLANIEDNQIKDIALLLIPESDSKLAGIQIISLSSVIGEFFDFIVSTVKSMFLNEGITKFFVYLHEENKFQSMFEKYGFIQDLELPLSKCKRIHMSYYI